MERMSKMDSWDIKIRESDYGLDLLAVLVRDHFAPKGFKVFDVSQALKSLRASCRESLAYTYGPGNRMNHLPQLQYMWMSIYDPAYLLVADCVAEFCRTGELVIDDYDRTTGEFTPKVIHEMRITPWELHQLLIKLERVQNPDRPMCEGWLSDESREEWLKYINSLHEELEKYAQREGVK